jgi:hypothetical protein
MTEHRISETINFHLLRRKAIAFAAARLSDDDFDVIWGELPIVDEHDEMCQKAQKAAVAAIRSLLK